MTRAPLALVALVASLSAAAPAQADVKTLRPQASKVMPSKVLGMRLIPDSPLTVGKLRPYTRFTGGKYKGQMCWGPPRSDACSAAVAGRRVTNLSSLRLRVRFAG